MVSRCGFSVLTCPNRDSIQAWSVGVCGRPKRWAMWTPAKNSRVEWERIWGPLSETANSNGTWSFCSAITVSMVSGSPLRRSLSSLLCKWSSQRWGLMRSG